MHDPANELRKILLLGTSVNKLLGGALLHRGCHGYVPASIWRSAGLKNMLTVTAT
jgi:hypothetical protein